MKLSCVTATFNCIKSGNQERLIRCVESVAQLKTEHEHLIYDGVSTDGTLELLRKLEAKTPGLKVVSEPDMGIYNALNKGIRKAKGEWLYVLGADDYVVYPNVMDGLLLDCKAEVIITPILVSTGIRKVRAELIFFGMPYCHQGVICKTRVIRQYTGGFDEQFRICSDYDLMLRLHKFGCKIVYTNTPFAYFEGDGVSSCNKIQVDDEVAAIIRRHFGVSRSVAIWMRRNWTALPMGLMFRYMFHSDFAFRKAVWCSAKARCKSMLRAAIQAVGLLKK